MKHIFVSLASLCMLVLGCKPDAVVHEPAATGAPAVEVLPATAHVDSPLLAAVTPADYAGLHNVVAFTDSLYSGAVPEGDEGFATLQGMGIKTIISVDGEKPDLERAQAHGLRYVHLPIGYNGMDHKRTLEIARAVKELPGPIYLHCHHGKHRSAGAAGAAAVTLGELTNAEAVARMKVSGTAPNYKGLYQCVEVATIAKPEHLAQADGTFPEIYQTSGMVQSMVQINDAVSHLSAIDKAGWQTPANHPDLVPAAEAGRLADLLRVLHDDPSKKDYPAEYSQAFLKDSQLVETLEEGILNNESPQLLSEKFKAIQQSCKDCHATFRDTNLFID
jgi:protein tyrosine phosphatase (PTP) superfamily phosphohydrolase (DUF442 family)